MKRMQLAMLVLSFASLLLIPFNIQMVIVHAVSETYVMVDPAAVSVNVGEQIAISIKIVDVQNLYGCEVVLYWNSTILEAVSIDVRLGESDGVLHNPIYIAENSTQEGKYMLAASSTNPAPSFYGSGNIVKIAFNVINPGESTLDLESQLYDYPPPDRWPPISFPIEHATVDGYVDVILEFLEVIFLPLLAVLSVFAVVLSRKIRAKSAKRLEVQ